MGSPDKKSKKEKKSKFEDQAEEKSILQDDSIASNPTSNKRKGMDMSKFSAELGEEEGTDPTKKIKVSMNPWTSRPYSKKYYEILKSRQSLPAWEAKG